MANVDDVAAYIMQKRGPMTAMKLQKLAYYSHAWHLVWEERPLFSARIEAWANGPVVKELYRKHSGVFMLDSWAHGDPSRLDKDEKESIEAVLDFYGDRSAHELSELTHRERPWLDARKGLLPGERGVTEITDDALFEYYDSLTTSSNE